MTTHSSQPALDERYPSPDTGSRSARTPLQEGDPRRIGRYRLTARLGTGGMGVVYLGVAEDGRLVAVKIIRPELADDPQFQARFGREAAALARVRGERVVRVIEAGTDTNGPFLVTEYAAGPLLATSVKSTGPFPAGRLSALAAGLAEALADIHMAGVVHRDLKPSNVILTSRGPKVIDFGIAQVLDSVSLTRTGVTIGSVGYMAPEQFTGQAGPAADIFAWAVTVAYAASGQPPFGTGQTDAVVYRILHVQPDLHAVPATLRPVVQAALAKEPGDRPAAHEILDQLTARLPAPAGSAAMPTVLAPLPVAPAPLITKAPQGPAPLPVAPAPLITEAPQGPARGPRRTRRLARIAIPAAGLAVITALALVALAGRHPQQAGPAGRPGTSLSQPPAAGPFGLYPGQQDRGVFQKISRMTAYGSTIVTTGTEVSDGVVRQQFFFSADGGRSWQLAPVRAASGGQPPLGYQATRVAGGPRGWAAIATGAPGSLWISPNGRSWTLAATHGLPTQPGDGIWVLTATAQGFLAAGQGAGGQAVIWTSPDGITWQRMTAAPLGLIAQGRTLASVSWAASFGDATVISGQYADGQYGTWLSTDGGSAWTPVTIPVTGGAEGTISGLAADGSGLIAVRPGPAADAIVYFSPNGLAWHYAATVGASGGLRPADVRGSAYGFAVTGADAAGNYVAYSSTAPAANSSTGPAASWLPTTSLGPVASYQSHPSATVGADGTVIVAGSTAASRVSQQAVLLQATAAGAVRPVPLARIPGAVVPELKVNSLAAAGGQQVAVGSADGYPAIWHRVGAGPWRLVSSPSLAASAGLSALTSVTHGADGWLAVGVPGPVVLTSANGTTWQPAAGSIAKDLAGVGALSAAAGPGGYVITGKEVEADGSCEAYLFHSADLSSWTRGHDVNDTGGSSQVLAVAADGTGFVSVGSHNDQPALWTTTNGISWTTILLPRPPGATGVLQQIAVNRRRVVAVGVQTSANAITPLVATSPNGGATFAPVAITPLAATSADGGATFAPVAFGVPGADLTVTALAADAAGFTAAIQSGAPGQQSVTPWTSATGTSWTPAPLIGLPAGGSDQLTALVPAGPQVTAIASAATLLSQRLVVLTLPAR
jgi:serine/threonine protein kinase